MLDTNDLRQEYVWSVPGTVRREGRGEQEERRPLLETGNYDCLNHDKGPGESNLQFLVCVYLLCDCREILNQLPGVMVLNL